MSFIFFLCVCSMILPSKAKDFFENTFPFILHRPKPEQVRNDVNRLNVVLILSCADLLVQIIK